MMNRINRIGAFLFLLMLAELCIGGGGRFTAVGPVSLRMILFSIALVISIVLLIWKKSFQGELRIWIFAFVLMISIGIARGMANQNPMNLIFEDVKPLCYFLVLPFFYLMVDRPMIAKTVAMIKVTSLGLAIMFVMLLVLINTGIVPFIDFYQATLKSQELFYRGEVTFFYKGFLYLGIGTIFYYFTDVSKWKVYALSVLVIGILLSVTRGLLFSVTFTFSIYFLITKSYVRAILGFGLVVIILVWGGDLILSGSRWFDAGQNNITYHEANPNLLGDRKYSDNGRITQALEVWQGVSFSSVFFGHGFGAGTPSRPVHMEVSYLEIFHKQGLIGLIFWAALAVMIFVHYQRAPGSPVANAFFYSSLFIYIESLTNQYINNPIGMSMLLLSLVCMYKLETQG